MLKNKMESYVRIERRGLKNLTYPYMGIGWVKNCQNHPYVNNGTESESPWEHSLSHCDHWPIVLTSPVMNDMKSTSGIQD